MTDTYESDNDDQADEAPSPRDLRQLVKDRTREADDLKAQIEVLQREAAFAKALGPAADDPPVRDYFIPGYKGELDAEQIRTAATEAGFLTPTTPEPSTEPPSRIAAASSGAGTPAPVDYHTEINQISPNDPQAAEKVLDLLERAGVPTTRTSQ